MGKVDDNKKLKMNTLLQTAFDLFTGKGFAKTTVSDIMIVVMMMLVVTLFMVVMVMLMIMFFMVVVMMLVIALFVIVVVMMFMIMCFLGYFCE